MTTIEQVRLQLQALLGLDLWGIGQSADLTWFEFGNKRTVIDRRGNSKEVGEYAIHVQCPWRMSDGKSILHGSGDDNITDLNVSFVVESVDINNLGGFTILLQSATTLTVFPDFQEDGEYWRIFQPYTQHEHFVVTSSGVTTD